MKAIVKTTREIVEVTRIGDRYVMTHHPHTITFEKDELDFNIEDDIDYWTRLEHQYAGMAMQGILSNYELYREISKSRNLESAIMEYASDLVRRLKEKEERK